jgi:O-antigen/teichoic acid export membrane protein
MVVSRIDVLMIRGLLGPEAVTLYIIAFFMGSVVGLPGRALSTSLRPVLSKAFARNDMPQVSEIYKRAAQSQFYINGTVLLFILANFNWVMLLLPEVYRFNVLLVFFIGLSQLISTSLGPNGIILQMSKKFSLNFYVGVLLLMLTIGLNYLFIPNFKLKGAAFAALLALVVFNSVKVLIIIKYYEISPLWKKFTTDIICLFAAIYFVTFVEISQDIMTQAIVLNIATFTYLVFLILHKRKLINNFVENGLHHFKYRG